MSSGPMWCCNHTQIRKKAGVDQSGSERIRVDQSGSEWVRVDHAADTREQNQPWMVIRASQLVHSLRHAFEATRALMSPHRSTSCSGPKRSSR